MRTISGAIAALALAGTMLARAGWAQTKPAEPRQSDRPAPAKAAGPRATPANTAIAGAHRGIALAEGGHCEQALPLLAAALPHLTGKTLLYNAAMERAKCGMALGRTSDALEALALLNRQFPTDAQVLYTTVHSLSQLSERAADTLVATDTDSPQAMELEAEYLLSHGQQAQAIAKYREIIRKYPAARGLHYRLGFVLVEEAEKAGDTPQAQTEKAEAGKEFEAELRIAPHSAAAEFMLGNLAWEKRDLPNAILYFTKATQDDAGFLEADLALGVALNAAGKYPQAIPPLEKYAQGEPDNPAGHYQLAIAYARTGRQQDAQRQMALQQAAEQKAQAAKFRAKPGS